MKYNKIRVKKHSSVGSPDTVVLKTIVSNLPPWDVHYSCYIKGGFSMTLTIYFDGQFWIGIVEMYENNKLKVCKHTFRTEPKDSEILDFIFHDMIPLLNNTSGIKNSNDNKKTKAINPKRLIRLTVKELKNQGVSNKSFEALRIELEQKKKMKQSMTRQKKEEIKERKRQIKIQKRKEKHRGK